MKKWAAALAIVLLIADIIGRIALVMAGLYPVDSFEQTFAIVMGTAIAAIFAIYIGWKWDHSGDRCETSILLQPWESQFRDVPCR